MGQERMPESRAQGMSMGCMILHDGNPVLLQLTHVCIHVCAPRSTSLHIHALQTSATVL